MREVSFGKRLLAIVLALVMVVGLGPVINLSEVFAATEDPVIVIAGSDFQPSDDNDATGASQVTALLNQIKNDYSVANGFLFAGDYSKNHYTASESKAGLSALQEAVHGVYGTTMDEIYIQGNHDPDSIVTDGTLSASGNNDSDDYGVYVINEKDYMWYNNDEDTIKETATALDAYLDAKVEAEYDKPIFVISHLPLHYSMRTLKGGNDGMHANYIFDVLNEGGANGLNIIFMFGHNHSHGWDDYLGGSAIYLAKGDQINIAQNSTTTYEVETLNFTYMNAGYVGYYGDTGSGVDATLTMTVFEITGKEVKVSRYDTNGKHLLKSAGAYGGEYPDSSYAKPVYSADTNTYTTAQTITLSKFVTGNEVSSNGVSVTAPNLTGVSVTKAENPTYDTNLYTAYASYDITPAGYTQGDSAEVTITLDAADGFDFSKPVMVIDRKENKYVMKAIVNGTVTFTTDHFSPYDLAQGRSVEIEIPGTGETTYTYTQATSITAGGKYVIVGNSNAVALMDNNGSIGSQSVTISGSTMTSTTELTLWTFSGASGGTVYNGTRYLQYSSSSWNSGFDLSTSSTTLTFTDNGSNFRIWNDAAYGTDYSFYYNGSSWTRSRNIQYVRLYQLTDTTSSNNEKWTVTIDSASGSVKQNAVASVPTGSVLTITDESGEVIDTVNVTVSMLKDANGKAVSTATAGTLTDLKVYYTYNGVEYLILDGYTLNVNEKIQNNYPDYPNEGAVKVSKTATGIDFQSSGVANVELSVSGVPTQKGADVVIVIDTSSSMDDLVDGKTRIDVLSQSLENMLKQFQSPNDNGMIPDVDIAIIDFNGYYDTDAGDFDKITLGGGYRSNVDYAKIFTGNNEGKYIKNVGVSASDFVDVSTVNAANVAGYFTVSNIKSGTNYDGALENAYNLLAAKQAANEDDRDAYVIFLSDGAPFRYNGFNNGSDSGYDKWNQWLTGEWSTDAEVKNAINGTTYDAYSHFYNGDGNVHPHRYAEAIKGSTTAYYDVIDRELSNVNPAYMKQMPGLGAKIYSIGFCLAADGDSSKGYVTVDTMQELIRVISSGEGYYYENVTSAAQLDEAFNKIVTEIAYAATNAYFLDQMGTYFDLQLTPLNYKSEGSTTYDKTITPTIEIKAYDIWTRQEFLNGDCDESQIGDRKGTYTVIETVTFTYSTATKTDNSGAEYTEYTLTGAYSNLIGNGQTNILGEDGVIYAKNFAYNTQEADVTVNGVTIEAESFYWNVGTVTTTELAISYYVYLAGSMEGEREAGSYATNNYATLYYDNYLGNPCYKDTTSPTTAWESALVRYAFYLVNDQGQPVNMNGEVVPFANRVQVTQPVVYEEILLNNLDQVSSIEVTSLGTLPNGYTLYDESAVYTVVINSNATGSWTIVNGRSAATTYVTGFSDQVQYSSALNSSSADETGYDYTHTTVWFAVVWSPKTIPDSVVIDFGLPVDIHVLSNDMFGDYGKLIGVTNGAVTGSATGDTTNKITSTTANGSFGTATVLPAADKDESAIRYTPGNMQMTSHETFTYSVQYTGDTNSGYYYGTVTVIPATTVYYEDTFVAYDGTATWSVVENNADITQDEDRPGKYSLSNIDANNIYGYDSAYSNMSAYSLNNVHYVTVDKDTYATATFTFYGTGCDIIGLTSSQTGVLIVQVYSGDAATGTAVKTKLVDTYYGYTKNADGSWTTTTDTDNALYQVPVMQVEGLEYGQYTVKLTASYYDALNNNRVEIEGEEGKTVGDGSYDLYLDAIRIYDPTGVVSGETNDTVSGAYREDGEAWPVYQELRNNVIDAATLNGETVEINGIAFMDGVGETAVVSDYISYGPNNELYLAPGQAIAFNLNMTGYAVEAVHLGMKCADEAAVSYKIVDGSLITDSTSLDAVFAKSLKTSTDMYYDITDLKDKTIVVYNSGTSGILSLTNVKITCTSAPTNPGSVFYVSSDVVTNITENMNTDPTFTPGQFTVDVPDTAYVGNNVLVTVKTSTDVEAVSVDGTVLTSYRQRGSVRTWYGYVSVEAAGTETVEVIAYNGSGYASEPITENITVTVSPIRKLINTIIGWLFG